ncbi:hypothetical protein PAXINDRAFT_83394, partial [Paxillus involutus ATCC 200175]
NWIELSLSPSGSHLATSAWNDNTAFVFDVSTGEQIAALKHSTNVNGISYPPSGKFIATGCDDKKVYLWEAPAEDPQPKVATRNFTSGTITKQRKGTRRCHGKVYCVRYSPSGDRIASGADSVQIWNAETGSGILSIRNSSVYSVAWTADGTHVIGGREAEVTIWNSHSGEQLRTWKAHNDNWITLSLSPSGTHLATFNCTDTAFVFDVSTGEQITALKHSVDVYGIAYSPSGQFIATGCDDKKVYLWEAPAEDPPAKVSFVFVAFMHSLPNELTAYPVVRTTIFFIARCRYPNLCFPNYHS